MPEYSLCIFNANRTSLLVGPWGHVQVCICFNNSPSDPNTVQRTRSMPGERNGDTICFNNPPSDPNIVQRLGVGGSSMPPQETSEDICFN